MRGRWERRVIRFLTCPECDGGRSVKTWWIFYKDCPTCRGAGELSDSKDVWIPAKQRGGIKHGGSSRRRKV